MSSRKVNDDVLIVDWPWVLKLTDMPLKPNGHKQTFKCPCGGVTKIGSWNSWLAHSMKQSCRQELSRFLYYDGNMTVKEIMSKDLPSPLKGSGTSNTRILHQNTNQTPTIARQRQHYTHTTRLAQLKKPSQAISHQSTHNSYPLHHHSTSTNSVLPNSLSSYNSTPQRQPHHDAHHLQIEPPHPDPYFHMRHPNTVPHAAEFNTTTPPTSAGLSSATSQSLSSANNHSSNNQHSNTYKRPTSPEVQCTTQFNNCDRPPSPEVVFTSLSNNTHDTNHPKQKKRKPSHHIPTTNTHHDAATSRHFNNVPTEDIKHTRTTNNNRTTNEYTNEHSYYTNHHPTVNHTQQHQHQQQGKQIFLTNKHYKKRRTNPNTSTYHKNNNTLPLYLKIIHERYPNFTHLTNNNNIIKLIHMTFPNVNVTGDSLTQVHSNLGNPLFTGHAGVVPSDHGPYLHHKCDRIPKTLSFSFTSKRHFYSIYVPKDSSRAQLYVQHSSTTSPSPPAHPPAPFSTNNLRTTGSYAQYPLTTNPGPTYLIFNPFDFILIPHGLTPLAGPSLLNQAKRIWRSLSTPPQRTPRTINHNCPTSCIFKSIETQCSIHNNISNSH